ncbi:MAG: DUF3488 and transglutaminase-like domain-containing protein [Woeseiaceae bacterium]|nr:DUF3488 and transglutaminase-like domain-containing protein [Woeseiaceae bacterium]
MAKPRGTDGSLLQSLPWTMSALVIAILPHVPYLPFWITGAFLGCASWRYAVEMRRRPLPSTWTRAGLALVCFLGVWATYSSISGVGPGSALLAIMAALKLLETRRRRDQFVLLFLSIFLVMSSLLREQYVWSLPYLFGSVVVIMTAWLRMAAGKAQTTRQSFQNSGRLVLYAVPIAIAMWVFFPRISTPFWAVPVDTSRATTGLSEHMSPGDISELSQSNEVAFRVTFDGPIPEPRDRYWRGLILTEFDGRAWAGSSAPYMSPRAREKIEVRGNPVEYEITLEPTMQQWVIALDIPIRWSIPRTYMGRQQQLVHETPIDQRISYELTSHSDYRIGNDLSASNRRWYSRLPDQRNPRTRQLARDMRADAGTDRDFVNAVLQKLNEEDYYYTLEPPLLGSDPVDRFLFDTRQGFCEHYASAFSVLMRSAGIPARIVLGYHGGEINRLGGHLIVRQSDAHAWVEVWIDDLGWHRVDPTAAVAPERIDFGASDAALEGIGETWGFRAPSRLLHEIVMTWDALNAKWNAWVLGYGPDTQDSFMQWLGMENPNWRKMILTLVGLVVGLVMLVSVLLMLRYRPPPRDPAAILYQRFVKKSRIEPRTGETARVFALRVHEAGAIPDEIVDNITNAYLDARYGPDDMQAFERLKLAVGTI